MDIGTDERTAAPPVVNEPEYLDVDRPHWGVLAGFTVFLSSFVFPVLLGVAWIATEVALGNVNPADEKSTTVLLTSPRGYLIQVIITLLGQMFTLALCWALVTRFGRQPFLRSLGWNWAGLSHLARFYVVAGVVIGVFCLQILLPFVLPESDTTVFEEMLKSSLSVRILVALMAVVSAPIVEEVIYRGVFYSGLRSKLGSIPAIVIVTTLFLLVHVVQYQGAWASLTGLLILSFLLTLIREKTKSVLPSFVIHFFYNCIGAAGILLSKWE